MSIGSSIGKLSNISSNFILSCESNDLNGYNIGDVISSWTDNSGLNNHLIQANGSRKPTYDIDAFGFKYLKFTQADFTALYSTNSYAQQSNLTIVMVCRLDELVSGPFKVFFYTGGNPLTDRISNSNIALWLSYIISNSTVPNSFITANNAYPTTSKVVIATRKTSSQFEMWLNGIRVINTSVTSFTPSATLQQFYLGGNTATGDSHINGGHYQIHVCAEALNDQNLKKIIRYAAFKSGVKI